MSRNIHLVPSKNNTGEYFAINALLYYHKQKCSRYEFSMYRSNDDSVKIEYLPTPIRYYNRSAYKKDNRVIIELINNIIR